MYANTEEFPIGGSKVLRSSDSDVVTVIAAGITLHESLDAYEKLKNEGVAIRLVDAYSVKPIDAPGILAAAAQTNNTLLVVEDHYYDGGLAGARRSK